MNTITKREIRKLLDATLFPFFRNRVYCLFRDIFKLPNNLQNSSPNSIVLDFPFYSNHSCGELPLPNVASVFSDCLLHPSFLGMAETGRFSTLLN